MAYDTRGVLRVDDGEGVRLLTFDRSDVLNAFNQDLWYATAEALVDARDDDGIRCVVMTDSSVYENQEPGYQVFMPVLEAFPKPVLAAVNGVAVGIGLTMLMHCDLVLVSTDARLKAPFISLGVTTEAAASYLMPVTMGWQRASELLYTERWLSPDEAVATGVALRAVPPERLLDETMDLARHIGRLPLGPLQATKRLLLAGRLDAVRAARERELAEFVTLVRAMSTGGG
jgi:enoyl-CoA hydratase/carnithine racemase